jgi:predicted small lipoprotein YifL
MAFAAAAAVCLAACGSRGPLDVAVVESSPATGGDDAGATVDANVVDAASLADATAVDAAPPPVDAAPEASLINCGACVAQSCGTQIVTCLTNTSCRSTLQCFATACLAGGTGSGSIPGACLLQCADGGTSTIVQLLPILTCITQSCGSSCGSALGGLGGSGGGSGGIVEQIATEPGASGREMFSAFPEVCGGR